MNGKLTQKQENFCMVYIETGNGAEAYRQAYNVENMQPNSIQSKAGELMANGAVTVRILELQEAHREQHSVTVDSLCTELDEARELALEERTAAPAVTAIMGKAKLHGLGLERRESKITGHMTLEQAEAILQEVGLDG